MSSQTTAYVVMSDPPEISASHAQEVYFDETAAETAAEDTSFGYVSEVPLKGGESDA